MQAPLIIVWEFRVPAGKRQEFENAYGSDGLWAQLFRRGQGYIRTELYRDAKVEGRYFTLDFWESRGAFHRFKEQNPVEYKSLDQQCSTLTAEESFIEEYETLEQVNVFLASHELPCINVRPIALVDLAAILALEQSAPLAAHWSETAYRALFDPGAPQRIMLVLEGSDRQMLGFAIARISDNDCELENIVVKELSRRSGYGRMLLHAVVASASLQRIARILLEVRESNVAARCFYERFGFALTGRRRSYYTNPSEDALNYRLEL